MTAYGKEIDKPNNHQAPCKQSCNCSQPVLFNVVVYGNVQQKSVLKLTRKKSWCPNLKLELIAKKDGHTMNDFTIHFLAAISFKSSQHILTFVKSGSGPNMTQKGWNRVVKIEQQILSSKIWAAKFE